MTKSAHVAIGGTNPIATPSNFFVHEGEAETIAIGRVNSQQVVGIETGAVTTVSFPEGVIGSPFAVGDSVALTVDGQSGYNIGALVKSITQTSVEPYQTKVELFHSTASGAPDETRDGLGTAELRSTFRVCNKFLGLGSGTLYIQQVQESGSV